jgi:hypothetical protein
VKALFALTIANSGNLGAEVIDPPHRGFRRIRRPSGTCNHSARSQRYTLPACVAKRRNRRVETSSNPRPIPSFHSEEGGGGGSRLPKPRTNVARRVGRDAGVEDEFRKNVACSGNQIDTDRKTRRMIYPTWSNPPRPIGDLNHTGGRQQSLFAPSTGFPANHGALGFHSGKHTAGMTAVAGTPW